MGSFNPVLASPVAWALAFFSLLPLLPLLLLLLLYRCFHCFHAICQSEPQKGLMDVKFNQFNLPDAAAAATAIAVACVLLPLTVACAASNVVTAMAEATLSKPTVPTDQRCRWRREQ